MPGVLVTPARQQDQQFLHLQQQAAAHIRAKHYTDALSAVDQMLQMHPNNHINTELHKVLTDKIQLDLSNSSSQVADESDSATDSDDGSEDTLSETASSADSQEQSEQQDSSDEESGDSETAAQPVDTCDTLHMTRNERTLSASQRQQLRNGLAEQLDELKVQQAAQSMQLLGL